MSYSRLIKGKNDLATVNPELAAQWHPTKNGDLLPSMVTAHVNKKVWWLGKCGHEWQASIYNRGRGIGCPCCAGILVIKGVNDLTTNNPKLAAQWHPTKNGDLLPTMVSVHSNKKVWWLGKCGHEWQASVTTRTKGSGCPYCGSRTLLKGFNDLATVNPELASQWHPTKNGDLLPDMVFAHSKRKVWWICPQGHEWQAIISTRMNGSRCPHCTVHHRYNGTDNLQSVNPILAAQWHPVKNGTTLPSTVWAYSKTVVWWLGDCGHEWQAQVKDRMEGRGCPVCGVRVPKIYTSRKNCKQRKKNTPRISLATTNPELAAQWHPTKNGDLLPSMVSPHSKIKVWWQGECGHEWQSQVWSRQAGRNCPICSGTRLRNGENSLATVYPELAAQWHPTKNANLLPTMVAAHSDRLVWWLCDQGHEWEQKIDKRTRRKACPYCIGRALDKGVNDLVTVYPDLAEEWHPSENGELLPSDVPANSHKTVWWLGKCGHKWRARIIDRVKGSKCPHCKKQKSRIATLAHPAEERIPVNKQLSDEKILKNAGVKKTPKRKHGTPQLKGQTIDGNDLTINEFKNTSKKKKGGTSLLNYQPMNEIGLMITDAENRRKKEKHDTPLLQNQSINEIDLIIAEVERRRDKKKRVNRYDTSLLADPRSILMNDHGSKTDYSLKTIFDSDAMERNETETCVNDRLFSKVGEIRREWKTGALLSSIDYDGRNWTLVVGFPNITKECIREMKTGDIQMTFTKINDTLFILFKAGRLSWMNVPFEPRLNPTAYKFSHFTPGSEEFLVLSIVDSASGELKAMRITVMGIILCNNLNKTCQELFDSETIITPEKSAYLINKTYKQFPTSADMIRRARAMGIYLLSNESVYGWDK